RFCNGLILNSSALLRVLYGEILTQRAQRYSQRAQRRPDLGHSPRVLGALTRPINADIMSDMKTFTVRELDREPAAVLDAADRDGVVRVKRRDGRMYSIQPETR